MPIVVTQPSVVAAPPDTGRNAAMTTAARIARMNGSILRRRKSSMGSIAPLGQVVGLRRMGKCSGWGGVIAADPR